MAKDGETLSEYNQRICLTDSKQDRLDKEIGRPLIPDWLKEIPVRGGGKRRREIELV